MKNLTTESIKFDLTSDDLVIDKLMRSLEISDKVRREIIGIFERYQHLIDVSFPDFTEHELWCIHDYLQGTLVDPITIESGLFHDFEEYDRETGEIISYPEISEKIDKMSINQRYALINSMGY